MQLHELTLATAIKELKSKTISHQELYAAFDKVVAEKNKSLNVYLALNQDADVVKKAATQLDQPLAGAPISVKDNFSTKGITTTASSKLLENFIPQFDATVVKNLKDHGGVVYGKANLDAWAHGSSTETSAFGRTLNPRNANHLPGGSSGGSAASVAADMALASIGSETAGSIRQPAAWCGTVGLKPTYGRCSRQGVVSMASSTDSPGTIAKTVEDAALLLNQIAGYDKYDGTSSNQSVPDFTSKINQPIKGLKIGVVYLGVEGLEKIKPIYEKQLQVFAEMGAEVEFVDALDPHYAISVYTIVQRGEVSSNLARYDDVRYGHDRSYFGDEAKRRIMLGTYTLSKGYADQYYNLAQKVRKLFIEDFEKLFSKYDVLVSPTSPGYAKKIGATDGEAMFGELEDMLLEPSSIAGLPGISVPCYKDPETNLYLGLNIMAPMWQEELCVQVGAAFEAATQWNSWRNK